jgi:hypothetical protein
VVVTAALAAGCQPTVTVEHKVDPIYITLDINVRVDRELDEFFEFEEEIEEEVIEEGVEPAETIDEGEVEIDVEEGDPGTDDGGDES